MAKKTQIKAAAKATAKASKSPLTGAALISAELATMPTRPGVYRMENAKGDVLYVGKAKNLKKRVMAYAHPERLGARMGRVVGATVRLEIVTTHTEAEALLLESNLIKRLKPRYNVLLRDDKTFPHITITTDHPWPRITKHRGAQKKTGEYFGPFASAGAVNATLAQLGRAFPLRSCSDNTFESRTRPCLQFQIKRCTAPCVGRIESDDYLALVEQVRAFLKGQSRGIQDQLGKQMQAASDAQDYETAAVYRDRIQALTRIQSHQDINLKGLGDGDVIALHSNGEACAIQDFFFRSGQNFGNRAYFPSFPSKTSDADILESFIGQFYARHMPPPLVMLSHPIPNTQLVTDALKIRAERKVTLTVPKRGARRSAMEHATNNAEAALARRLAENASQRKLMEDVAQTFGLADAPKRIEIYDNSHISGTNAVGAMVVAGAEGFIKSAYRKFNIKNPDGDMAPGDDYAMLREVLNRRFSRALREDARQTDGQWPDMVLIDGGPGQMSIARDVFADLGINDVALVTIAKGPDRNAGRERFFVPNKEPFSLPDRSPVLYFLQRLRDEAHRFAIGTQRAKRTKATIRSELDKISGIGASRKRALLQHFGAVNAVGEAGVEDLGKVEGISTTVARRIYDHFHGEP